MPSTGEHIDVHAHCVPQSVVERIEADGSSFGVTVIRDGRGVSWDLGRSRSAPIEPLLIDLRARIARMDQQGVAVQLVSGFIDVGAHHAEARHADAYARFFNDELATMVAAAPTRLRGLATLPVHDPDAAVTELRRAVGALGFVGAEIAASVVGDPVLEPLWEAAAALGAIILVHPEAANTSDLPYFLGNFVGNPAETTTAAAALIMSGVLERHRDLVIVLVHGGGFLPYQAGRLEKGFREYGERFGAPTTESPLSQLRRLHYDTILHDPAALTHLVSLVGAERVLLGTDDPFAMGDPDPRRTVDRLTMLSVHERDLIRAGNARRLLSRFAG